jgi:hypothetical protein
MAGDVCKQFGCICRFFCDGSDVGDVALLGVMYVVWLTFCSLQWDATLETVEKLIELGIDVTHKAKGKVRFVHLV